MLRKALTARKLLHRKNLSMRAGQDISKGWRGRSLKQERNLWATRHGGLTWGYAATLHGGAGMNIILEQLYWAKIKKMPLQCRVQNTRCRCSILILQEKNQARAELPHHDSSQCMHILYSSLKSWQHSLWSQAYIDRKYLHMHTLRQADPKDKKADEV